MSNARPKTLEAQGVAEIAKLLSMVHPDEVLHILAGMILTLHDGDEVAAARAVCALVNAFPRHP